MALHHELPEVVVLYCYGLACIFPSAAELLQNVADRYVTHHLRALTDRMCSDGVLFFGNLPDMVKRPNDRLRIHLWRLNVAFAISQHCHKDHAPVAYDMWWEPSQMDHDKTAGGEFIWGAFNISVNFNKLHLLVVYELSLIF
ncbi:hypothetical protein B0H16DRAFT_1697764 [Mycena metata]|uniref:Uncharacterized protein n=1 Tax=Mycena metata TaxID=1033252 RepID=A0AAD7MPW2_9AGAR|nr:hypothetical protein B0H16DRAFT_1697764 [Mycena metata]